MISAPMIGGQMGFTYFDYFAAFKTMVFSQVCPGIGAPSSSATSGTR